MGSIPVNADNFVRAETARMFDGGLLMSGGGINSWLHTRLPASIDQQNVIRMNRDTLYSSAVVDISKGATLTLPNSEGRYMTLMVVNEDHYINGVFHHPGTYELTVDEFDTPFVALVLRTLVDPSDPEDVAAVTALQDATTVVAGAATLYEHPGYEEQTRRATFDALIALSAGLPSRKMFGRKEDVDPVRHLVGTASGWGGLPEREAVYYLETEPRQVGRFAFTLEDVPVDGFWSLTVYNRDGFLEKNPFDSYSINNLTAVANEDGSVTINLAPDGQGLGNHLYVMDGWNYALRLYRPRPAVLNGAWSPPQPRAIT